MQIFEIQGPDGTVFEVEANTIEEAAAAVSGMGQGQKPWHQRLRENLFGDNDPNTQNIGEKIGTALNKAGESMTFGLVGDEASAAAAAAIPGGMGYDERLAYERQQEALLDQTNPGMALAADVGGAVGGALLPMGAIGTLGRGAGMGARLAASTAAGAGMGGTAGFMEGEGLDDRIGQGTTGAAIGAGVGFAAPLVGAGVQKIADNRVANRAIREAARGAPSSEELRRVGSALYDEVDNAGVQIRAPSFNDARAAIVDKLRANTAYTPRPGGRTITPNTSAVVDNMADMAEEMAGQPGAALSFKEIDSLRRQAGAAAGNIANKSDQQAGMTIIEGLDDFVNRLGPDDVAAGDVEALKTLIPKARDVWARMSKSQLLDDAIEAGDSYLSGPGTGVKYQFKRILKNPKLSRGFNEAEKRAMQRVINGTIPEQLLRLAGSGLTQIGGTLAAGFGLGPLAGAATLGASTGARLASDAVIRRNAEIARALVSSGKMNTLPVASPSVRAITEALARRTGAAGAQ